MNQPLKDDWHLFCRPYLEQLNPRVDLDLPVYAAGIVERVLAVRADVSEEAVYQITRAIFENLGSLHEIHRATRELTLETALGGLGAPLHPGALRYYREQGVEIPDRLVPP